MNGVRRKKLIDNEEELYLMSAPRTRQKFELRHINSEVSNLFQDSLRSLILYLVYLFSFHKIIPNRKLQEINKFLLGFGLCLFEIGVLLFVFS
jgi:hypothetical protein